MRLYNSLTRKKEEFTPIHGKKVGLYTCGPTIYSYVTIGNWRTYILSDLLVRTLQYFGYEVNYVMNITDVGHLTGDNLGDADTGDDRLEKAAQKEGKSAWDIAEFYTKDFLQGLKDLNLIKPKLTKATDHIHEQIELVQQIKKAGFAYKIPDGIYFNVVAYEKAGHKYGELSTLDQIKEGSRVEKNPDKKDPRDFALWKFSYPNGRSFDPKKDDQTSRRHMEWESPWGIGFPGWHIECSAMSTKYLGEQFDVHIGGEDLLTIHHPNEIAQVESVTNKAPFVKYWIHGAFLLIDGGKMGKSLGNAYTLIDIKNKNFNPLALRYFYLTGHYRKQQNFTWEALKGAQIALDKLRSQIAEMKHNRSGHRTKLSEEKLQKIQNWQTKFRSHLENDLDMPGVIATIWEMLKDNISDYDKVDLLLDWDQVLGLDLNKTSESQNFKIPKEVEELVKQREQFRSQKKWDKADGIRKQIEKLGFILKDTSSGPAVKPR